MMMRKKYLALLGLLMSTVAFSQDYRPVSLVDDGYGSIEALTSTGITVTSFTANGTGDYNNSTAKVMGGQYFFTADDGDNGEELWVSDGTRVGTYMLKDINPGTGSSSPFNLVPIGDVLYFTANDGTHGIELWKTDGTQDGTELLIDLYVGSNSSAPNTITPFGDKVLFVATDQNSANYDDTPRQHLWITNGTASGTTRLSADNVNGVVPKTSGDADFRLSKIQVIGNKAIFGGTDETFGEEIWVTDGTPQPWGTKMLVDINDDSDNSNIQWIIAANSTHAVFRAKTPGKWNGQDDKTTLDNEFWVTDGTSDGTYFLKDYNVQPLADDPNSTGNTGGAMTVVFDGKVYARMNDGITGIEPTIIDVNRSLGDDSLIYQLANISGIRNGQDRNSFIEDPIVWDNRLWMKLVFDGDNNDPVYRRRGQELGFIHKDGRVELVADIFPGGGTSSFPRQKVIVNGRMYFVANNASNQSSYDIWAVDRVGGPDPVVPEGNDLSKNSNYIVYKVFDDQTSATRETQSCLEDLNGKLMFVTIDKTLVVYDAQTEDINLPEQQGDEPVVTDEENAYLNAVPEVTLNTVSPESNSYDNRDGQLELRLTASASDPEGEAISKVVYFIGTPTDPVAVGESTTGPDYEFVWSNVPASGGLGVTTLWAQAYVDDEEDDDDEVEYGISNFTTFSVTGNDVPVVSISSPVDRTYIGAGAVVEIVSTAIDNDGIERVDFYVDGDSIGTDTEGLDNVYGVEWTAPSQAVDSLEIKVVVYDNQATNVGVTEFVIAIGVVEDVLSSIDYSNNEDIVVYPNPSSKGYLRVKLPEGLNTSYKLYSVSGVLVASGRLLEEVNTIDTKNIATGLYKLIVESDELVSSETVVIK